MPDLELAGWGILLELALLALWAFSGVWRGSGRLIAGFFLPGALFCLVAWRVVRARPMPVTWRTRAVLLGFAALFHLTLLLTPSPLSNDLYRYFWDGKLVAHGVNPYKYPPAAAELAVFQDPYWELIFNPDVPTGYPPLAEGLFAAAYRLAPTPWALRGMAAFASLAAAALLMAALSAAGRDERRALLYAWSPLVALEFANSAHLDVFAVLCMNAALLCSLKRRPAGAAACLALGGLVKFFPVLLLPVWGRRWGKTAWLAFGLVFSLPWLPFLAGGTPFKGLGIFAARGDFNNSLYRLVENLWFFVRNDAGARLWARATIFAFLALFFLIHLMRQRGGSGVLPGWRFAGAFLGLCLALSPVVHPWYVCWMLAFIAVEGRLAWLVLSVTVIFARHVYIGYEQTGLWQEAWWSSLAVWIPFYLTLALSLRPYKMFLSLRRMIMNNKPVIKIEIGNTIPSFENRLRSEGFELRCSHPTTVQINLGKLCSQSCAHCHVEAGPDRKEVMSAAVMKLALDLVEALGAGAVDLTGGAPELNPSFRYFIVSLRRLDRRVIVRSNLAVLTEPGMEDLPEFFAENKVEVIASLPCYTEENVDHQRGAGVFQRSIAAIRRLNALGYGREGSGLLLHLVYNPQDAELPGPQSALDEDYHRELRSHFGLVFNHLYTLTNMPIGRFARRLRQSGEMGGYTALLAGAFNPATLDHLMCLRQVSVSWDGYLYDCDFNQMLDLKLGNGKTFRLGEMPAAEIARHLEKRLILTGPHCYGCTAGSGSSCGGSLL